MTTKNPISPRSFHADQLPTQLYLEVTNRCNSLCASCPLTYKQFDSYEPKHHLSWEEFRRIVDQFPRLERVVLHGIGEPLLNPALPRFIAYLKTRQAQVLFNTNAILLDLKRGDALVAAGLDELRISLDATSPGLYARLRGVDQLPRVVRNITAFIKRHGGEYIPRVSLWWVAMQANLHQLPDFIRLAVQINVPEVYLQRLVYFGDGESIAQNTTMKADESLFAALEDKQQNLIRECEDLAQENGLIFRASGATTPHESINMKGAYPWQGCLRPWNLMYITANGTSLPCCISPFAAKDYQQIILGNVLQESVDDVWNNSSYQALRSSVLSESPAPWPCQYCGVHWSL